MIFRVMMFYNYMKGLHQEESLENFKQLFGKNAPLRTQVCFWFGEVGRCRQSFNDEYRHTSDCCYGNKHRGSGKINQGQTKG